MGKTTENGWKKKKLSQLSLFDSINIWHNFISGYDKIRSYFCKSVCKLRFAVWSGGSDCGYGGVLHFRKANARGDGRCERSERCELRSGRSCVANTASLALGGKCGIPHASKALQAVTKAAARKEAELLGCRNKNIHPFIAVIIRNEKWLAWVIKESVQKVAVLEAVQNHQIQSSLLFFRSSRAEIGTEKESS